jgi:hypothetical protein
MRKFICAPCKVGFVMDECGWKLELSHNFNKKSSVKFWRHLSKKTFKCLFNLHIKGSILSLLSLFKKNTSRLMRSPCCLCVCVSPTYHLLNAWTNLYETWYVYHGTWVYLSGVLHKSLPSACAPVCIIARHRLGKKVAAATNTFTTVEESLDALFYMRSVSYQRKIGD